MIVDEDLRVALLVQNEMSNKPSEGLFHISRFHFWVLSGPKASLMDIVNVGYEEASAFADKSKRLLTRCAKPTTSEFVKIAKSTGIGFLMMGAAGFFVKLLFIPVNNIIIGLS